MIAPRGTARTRSRILLADDDALVRRIVRQLLIIDGHDVIEASTGHDTIEQFRRESPDLVLLDVHMPDGSGFDACAALREMDREEAVPIIMLTALDDLASVEHAFRLRATDFIAKPFKHRVLQQRVRHALRSRGMGQEVRRSRARQAVTLHMAKLTFWEWRPVTDELTWSSDALPLDGFEQIPPSSSEAFLQLLHPDDAGRLSRGFALTQAFGERLDLEVRLRNSDQVLRIVGSIAEGEEWPLISGALQDVTPLRRSEALAEHLAHHDEVTGLPNRRGVTEQLRALLASTFRAQRCGATGTPTALLVAWLDITRFRRLDDALGERAGDLVLTRVGRRIREVLPAIGAVGRVGGDEFVVAITGNDDDDARRTLKALLEHLREPVEHPDGDISLSWSAGYVMADAQSDASELLVAAEGAQRSARMSGRALSRGTANTDSHERAALLLRRERGLRTGLATGAFSIVVQPQVDARTLQMVGVECLLRWRDESGHTVLPGEFASILEESDLIVEVGAWVLAESCAWHNRWRDEGIDVRVGVNLSPRQFSDPAIVERFASIIGKSGVPANRVELELTESVAMQNPAQAVEVFTALRALGVRVAIDDFGVGYSSLAYLAQFPLDTLKLDRSFTIQASTSRRVESIIRGATVMADGIGLRTVAEGVETAEQAAVVTGLGVTELQGYFVAHPMPPESLAEYVRQRRSVVDEHSRR